MGRSAWTGLLLVGALVSGCGGAASTPVAASASPSPSPTSTPALTSSPTPTATPSGPRLTADDLKSAPVPGLCKHHAGRLKNGSLPGIPKNQGTVEVLSEKTEWATGPVHVGLLGDGVDELAAVIDCNQGGVPWPEVLVVYRPGPELLGWFDVETIAHAEQSTIKSIEAEDTTVRITVVSTDGCCSNERDQTAVIGWDGSSLVVRHLTTRWVAPKDQCSVADLETAWSGGKQDCLEPEVLSHLFYPGAPFTTDSAEAYLQNVVFIQLRLRDLKYDVAVDGKYGPATAAVVRKYQQDKGLTVDGETGLQTWKSLFGLGLSS